MNINDNEVQCRSNSNMDSTSRSETPVQHQPFRLTMEVPLFFVILASALSGTVIFNLLLYRTCKVTLQHEEGKCKLFLKPEKSNETDLFEDEVQKYAIFISTVKLVMESSIPAILSFFLGSWSDKHGRLPLISMPLVGMFLSNSMVAIYSMIKDLGPWWLLLTSIPFALSGGYAVLFTGAYCYVSDITTAENRSLRMTILDAVMSVAFVLGSTDPFLIKVIGNTYLLTVVSAILVAGYVFTQLCLNESVKNAEKGNLKSILNVSLVRDMFHVCFLQRPNNLRAILILLVLANALSSVVYYGLFNIEYLYMRLELHWAMKEFTLYSAVDTTLSFAGNFIGIGIVQKLLHLDDVAFAVVSFVSTAVKYILTIRATSTWQMYFGSAISLFKGLSTPLIRSVVTQILPVQDIAKVLSMMGALDGVCPLLSPIIFNSLYAATVSSFPMSIYILSISFTAVSIGMLGLVKYYERKPSYQILEQENVT